MAHGVVFSAVSAQLWLWRGLPFFERDTPPLAVVENAQVAAAYQYANTQMVSGAYRNILQGHRADVAFTVPSEYAAAVLAAMDGLARDVHLRLSDGRRAIVLTGGVITGGTYQYSANIPIEFSYHANEWSEDND